MSGLPEFLAGQPLFRGMDELERGAVAARLESRPFTAGTKVFAEGETGSELYLVRSGRIGSYVTQGDGSRRDIYEFQPGNLFGEMAVIEGQPRSATCFAKEDAELLVLGAADFYGLIQEHPLVGAKLLASMARVMTAWLDEASSFLGGLARWGEAARRRAVTDGPTGLFNRRFLEENLRLRFAPGGAGGPLSSRRCSLLMLDIDRFREINGAYGMQGGDAVIAATGKAFGFVVGEKEVAARLSGDEFAVFLPEGGPERALELGERLRSTAEGLILELQSQSEAAPGPGSVSITVSIGAASCPEDAVGAADLLACADKALYRAKEAGRNCVFQACTD